MKWSVEQNEAFELTEHLITLREFSRAAWLNVRRQRSWKWSASLRTTETSLRPSTSCYARSCSRYRHPARLMRSQRHARIVLKLAFHMFAWVYGFRQNCLFFDYGLRNCFKLSFHAIDQQFCSHPEFIVNEWFADLLPAICKVVACTLIGNEHIFKGFERYFLLN